MAFRVGTLGRQLLSGTSLIFLLALLGIGGIYLANARLYLQEQLEAHAQETATSLGLSLGLGLARSDPSFAETAINAVFDRGFYERIAFVSPAGEVLVERRLPPSELGVPEAFARLLPLYAPTATSLVSAGWRQAGVVMVTSHPRFAYRQLLRTGVQTFGWLAAIYAFALLAMQVFLSGILRPLQQISDTASAISRREFRTIELSPKAAELRSVVDAMNDLSAKVRSAIESETTRAEQLQRQAYTDAVTGLSNRSALTQLYDVHVRNDREVHSGTLAIIALDDMATLNRLHGYGFGDEVLKRCAATLRETLPRAGNVLARTAGASFVVLWPNVEGETANAALASLGDALRTSLAEGGYDVEIGFHCGAASFQTHKPSLGELLSAADGALESARSTASRQASVRLEDMQGRIDSSSDWLARISAALDAGRIALYAQPVVSIPQRQTLHVEVTARLIGESGTPIPAAQFFPMAARHGLAARLDRVVVEAVLARLAAGTLGPSPVAVNVSSQAMRDGEFLRWLTSQVRAHPAHAPRLIFEITDTAANAAPDDAAAFAAAVRGCRARLALDNFGLQAGSLRMLAQLLPEYVKLASAHSASLRQDAPARFFIESVARIGRSLSIPIIAQAVEDEGLLELLATLDVAGAQGYAIARPAPVEGEAARG